MIKALPVGKIITNKTCSEQYIITEVIGQGASTIAYKTRMDNGRYVSTRILKEYCPNYVKAKRTNDGKIECDECDKLRFDKGMSLFAEAGQKQNQFREFSTIRNQTPPLVNSFEANNTLYLDVIPFEGTIYENIHDFSLKERMEICLAIAKLINLYHKEGYLCLDVKPSNIFVLKETTEIVEFIDFDSIKEKDKVCFGNSLSYTKTWAAPEQENPYRAGSICEATDVYAMGEIVFWSLFDRHSCVNEHRKGSEYPFYESRFVDVQRSSIRELLSILFKNTIRSAVENRFSSMEPVIDILESVNIELSKEEVVNSFGVFTKDFFVGRRDELKLLDQSIQEHKIVFVSGVPGIGKSELVKRYIDIHKKQYNNILYWFYEGDFQKMVCNDYSVSITNFYREEDETDSEYSRRKLIKLKELVDEKTLIFIDNLDVLIEDIDSPELWKKLKTFPGKIIVTTRCGQKNYKTIKLTEINDTDILKEIYYKYSPSSYGMDEEMFVDRIIEKANYHTYEIELLAAHAEAERKSPSQLLEDMEQYGIGGFDRTNIQISKDGDDISATFSEHLQKIFSLNGLSVEQKGLLLKIAFVPNGGVDIRQFKLFYAIDDYNDLNWLISHGLVYETMDGKHLITIHPSVAEMTVNALCVDRSIICSFYQDAIRAMRRGYDDETVNQNRLLQIDTVIEQVLINKENVSSYEKGELTDRILKKKIDEFRWKYVQLYEKTNVEQGTYVQICNALAFHSMRYRIPEEIVARFLTQYVQWFMKYGHYEFLRDVILVAKFIYDKTDQYIYFQDREYMYEIYCTLLLKEETFLQEAADFAKEHLRIAVRAKDWEFASNWCNDLRMASEFLNESEYAVIYQAKEIWYSLKSIWNSKKKRCDNSFIADNYYLMTKSLWMNERKYEDCVETSKISILLLKLAIYRRKIKSESINNLSIYMDKAKIKMLQNDFDGANEELQLFLELYEKGEQSFTETLYEAFELMGEINFILGNYEYSLALYQKSLKIAKKLGIYNVYGIRAQIGRIYSKIGMIELSKKSCLDLIEELEEKNIEATKIVLADIYLYNAEICGLEGEYNESLMNLDKAEDIYCKREQWSSRCKIGKIRCNILKAQILKHRCGTEGVVRLRAETKKLEAILGERHPEILNLKK